MPIERDMHGDKPMTEPTMPGFGLRPRQERLNPPHKETVMEKLKSWTPMEIERFAAKLLVLNREGFHGSLTIHFAAGIPRKVEEKMTRDI